MLHNPSPRKNEKPVPPFYYPTRGIEKLLMPTPNRATNFWTVLDNRRSVRQFKLLSIEQISQVLWYSAKVQHLYIQDSGYILTQRSSPSAGGRHPIDILVKSAALADKEALHYYNPFSHVLHALSLPEGPLQLLEHHIQQILPMSEASILWFIAHPIRMLSKYENGESLIWRDAGALIQNVQLVASALAINTCPLGTLGEPFISEMFRGQGEVYGVGGLLAG